MQLTPEERERIYQEEKARHEARQQLETESERKRKDDRAHGCAMAVAGMFLLLILVAALVSITGDNESSAQDDIGAFVAARRLVREQLKAPSTAEFCDYSAARIAYRAGEYTVAGWVDAQNSFGATLRKPFVCRVRRDAGGFWVSAGPCGLVE